LVVSYIVKVRAGPDAPLGFVFVRVRAVSADRSLVFDWFVLP
jgi:hypothetical protein